MPTWALGVGVVTRQTIIPYYHPLNQWLLGATNGNQGHTVMHLYSSEDINHP